MGGVIFVAMGLLSGLGTGVVIVRSGRRMVVMRGGGSAMIIVTVVSVGRSRGMVVVTVGCRGRMGIMSVIGRGRVTVIVVMTVRSGRSRGVMSMIRMGGFVMLVGGGLSGVAVVVMTLCGIVTVARILAVIVVRLVLVAHCDSVPQPLFAVFAAKSV